MKNAVILHGRPGRDEYYDASFPSANNSHWIPWLQKQLLINDIYAQTPEIPKAFNSSYEVWKKEFERFDISDSTLLVGHSKGAGFIVRWLSENSNLKVGKIFLVAPYIDPDKEEGGDFFNFEIDNELTSRTAGLSIFNSLDDMTSVTKSVQILRDSIRDTNYIEFANYGHFTRRGLGKVDFPELLELILK